MTATSSLPFASMEVPVEDSMEMASPYDRPADDFDIDIDLMEENVANMDSDMMGADDPPNTSQPSLFQNDLTDDADMADESLEGSMVDDENIIDEDYDVDIHFDETYETEMLEDDQTETIDDTPATIPIDVTETTEGQTGPTQDLPVEQPVDTAIEESTQEPPAVPDIPQTEPLDNDGGHATIAQDHDAFVENHEVESATPENPQNETARQINNDDNVEPTYTNQTTEEDLAHVEEQHAPSALSVENPEVSGVESPHEIAAEHPQNAETPSVHETEDHGAGEEPLHPVKVLYQDNDISLFPPFEGDSSETFFLHDDSVAYDSFGKLFSSLRGVLLDNIAGNEVLVIDIDALGIQLTEDSLYASKVTLHQILSIYLRLCYNDGTHEPEALYLTLSSRLAVDSELASLDAAANEGKGLSQLDLWDDLDEADVENEEVFTAGEAAHPSEEPPQGDSRDDESAHMVTAGPEQQSSLDEELEGEIERTNHAEQHPGAEYERSTGDQANKPDLAGSDTQGENKTNQTEERDPTEAGMISHEHQDKDHFGSEPGTASTSTVAPNEQPHDPPVDFEDTADHPNLDDSTDQAAIGTGDDAFDEAGFPEQHEVDEEKPEIQNVFSNEDETQVHSDPTAAQEDEADPTDVSQHNTGHTSYDQAESTGTEVAQDTYYPEDQTPEPEDDLFGIAEDLMQTPAKDRQNVMPETPEGATQGELAEDDLAGSVNGKNGADQQLDDGDLEDWYPDFEITEATELGETDPSLTDSQPHDNPSTKRSREGDEEWDLTDATTPDTKRRRS